MLALLIAILFSSESIIDQLLDLLNDPGLQYASFLFSFTISVETWEPIRFIPQQNRVCVLHSAVN